MDGVVAIKIIFAKMMMNPKPFGQDKYYQEITIIMQMMTQNEEIKYTKREPILFLILKSVLLPLLHSIVSFTVSISSVRQRYICWLLLIFHVIFFGLNVLFASVSHPFAFQTSFIMRLIDLRE